MKRGKKTTRICHDQRVFASFFMIKVHEYGDTGSNPAKERNTHGSFSGHTYELLGWSACRAAGSPADTNHQMDNTCTQGINSLGCAFARPSSFHFIQPSTSFDRWCVYGLFLWICSNWKLLGIKEFMACF